MKRNLFTAVCLLLVLAVAGCSWFGKKPEKTATELATDGEKYFAKKDYEKSIEVYKRLKDWYPYSKFAKEAEIRIADSHYNLKQYDDALFAYEQFEQLHPSEPKIPYVIYQIGLCHYDRMEGIDRTQVPAKNALEAFQRLRSRFPGSEYAEKAKPMIEAARKNMAGHELYIGRFYFKNGHYKAAIKRFEKVLNKYPDEVAYRDEAKDYLEQARTHLKNQDKPVDVPEPLGTPDTAPEIDRGPSM